MTFLCTGGVSRLNAFSGLALQYSLSQQTITVPTNQNQLKIVSSKRTLHTESDGPLVIRVRGTLLIFSITM